MPKRPWNRVNLPVYSVCSCDENARYNMQIITYASQISMKPKRYICGIYHHTQTWDNLKSKPVFVLQLLASHQYRLVDLLGKKSGKEVDKIARLEKRKLLTRWKGFPVLKDCLAIMELSPISVLEAGDHTALLCEVSDYKNMQEGQPLTLDILREKKLIRI